MLSKEFMLFLVIPSFVFVRSEVILPSIVEEPKCEYDGLEINLMNAGLQSIGGDIFSSSSVNPFINCINLSTNCIANLNVTAFRNLPNLYYLDLSNNVLPSVNFLYDFSTVKTLVLNGCFNSCGRHECGYYDNCGTVRLRVFSSLPNLKKLYLQNNQLRSLSWKRGTPNITHLYLDYNGINPEFLSLYIPPTLTHLSLSNNGINQFDRSPILKQLEEFNLSNNEIQILCSDDNCHDPLPQEDSDEAIMDRRQSPVISQFMDLKGATNLKRLSISFNKIHQIRQNTFSTSINLQYLDLAHNSLGKNPNPDDFEHLSNLNILILDNNKYTTIPPLFRLYRLETLMLKGNEIEAITSTSFDDSNLLELKVLSLANNVINRIDAGSFNSLLSLEELDLSGNQLVALPVNWITLELQRLHLDRNRFTNIENMALQNMTRIQYLNIAKNPFEKLSMQTLRNLPENTVVNVKDIQLVNNKPSNCSGVTVDN